MKTKKLKLPTITTRAEADHVMTVLATQLNASRGLIAARDGEVLRIHETYAEALEEYDAGIKARTAALTDWIEAHPEEFPKGKKTLALSNGTISQRTGTPALKLLRGWTWERVLGAVMAKLPNFVRSKPEVDKEAILAQRDELAGLGVLEQIGVKVDQGEKIHIEPNLTDTTANQTVAA